MRNDTFVLFGADTLEMLSVSCGGPYRAQWSLEQHPGPSLMTHDLSGQEGVGPRRYLYPQHLRLLYERFRQANPAGVELGDQDMIDARYSRALGRAEFDRLLEARKAFVTIDAADDHLGCPYLRPYLPEIFEPEVVRQMEADPWLDADFLQDAIRLGRVPDRRDYHPRWSPEWRAYCDRVMARQNRTSHP